jgi:uncharacterized protein
MSINDPVIILTAHTLFTSSEGIVNQHNRQTNGRFPQHNGQGLASLLESNCACAMPEPLMAPQNTAVNHQTPMQWSGYTQPLVDDYHLCFDIEGQAGAAVVNEPAYRLLQAFRSPKPVASGLNLLKQPDSGQEAVEHLIQTGLLRPPAAVDAQPFTANDALTTWVHVTNECNLRCPYCYVDKTSDKMALERGYQAIDAVFRSAVQQQFSRIKLKYAGGEATLNFPTVIALHQYAQQKADRHQLSLDGVVLSNGVALSDRMILAMKEIGLRLMISLDGVGQYHDAQRPFINGRGSFPHLERTLDRLARHRLIPSISITISRHNLAGLPEVVAYVLERGLPFTLNFFRDNEACGTAAADLRYEEDQLIEAMLASFKVIEANLPPYSLLGNLLDLARLDNAHEHTCGVGHSYMVINHQGGVAKCHMALDQTVATVADPDPLRLIQIDRIGVQNLPVSEKEGCRTCEWQNWCAGGCPALTYRLTGRYDIKSPNCRIYKALFPEALRLEGLRLLKYSGLA